MNKKGFTLLELIIVIIILGILATLGFTQYAAMIEKSRGAEARSVLGDIRKQAAAIYMGDNTIAAITAPQVGITATGIPAACRVSHYFSYAIAWANPTATITATRCVAGGKNPNATVAGTLVLTSNLATGVDAWASANGY